MEQLSQAQCSLGDVLEATAFRLQQQFANLLRRSSAEGAENRPQALLSFVHGARQQLLRSAAPLYDTRKYVPLSQLNQEEGVFRVSQAHAQALQTAADELFKTNDDLKRERVPLFNVPDSLDVLSTGTYSSLPASIHSMRGPKSLPKEQQQRLIAQMNHMLYSQLLKADLPASLELVQVTGGYAVLQCKGLYEVQLSLVQQPYPLQAAEAREEAAAAVAGDKAVQQQQQVQQQAGDQLQQGVQLGNVPAAAETAVQQQANSSGDQAAPPPAELRWTWSLSHAVLLPNAAVKPPLRQVQLDQLLRALRERMWCAADAAAVEAAKRSQDTAADGDEARRAASGRTTSQQQSSGSAQLGSAQPSASGMTGGSAVSGLSTMSAAAAADAGRGLELEKYNADEVALPLRVMHGVLRDVAAQILLHEVRIAAEKLAGPGSKWEGQLKLAKAEVLTPGLRLHYWQQVPVLLASQPGAAVAAGTGNASSAGAPTAAAAATAAASLPAVEVGLGSDGTVQVMHMPPLRLPGTLQQVPLVLDCHTVDVEGLLLQAVAVTASVQLQMLRKAVGQLLMQRSLQHFVQLQLCSFGQAAKAAQAAAAPESNDGDDVTDVVASGAADAGDRNTSVTVAMPDVLVLVLDGHALVTVSFQPWSGCVVLRPGSAYGGDLNMEMGISLHQHQETLQQKQEAARQLMLHRKGPLADQQAALTAIQDIAAGLTELCGELWMRLQLTNFLAAARMLALHHTHTQFRGLVQSPQLLYLPSAAAAMANSGPAGAGAVAAAAADSAGAGSSITGVRTIRSSSQHTMYLAMPNLQLPPYMLLLAPGIWSSGFSSNSSSRAGTAWSGAAAAGMAALCPTLCMSFPRRRVVGESRDCLLLTLSDAQGLVGPVLKRIRLPVSTYTNVTAAPGAAAGEAAAAAAAAVGQRKRKRGEEAATSDAAAPQDGQQQAQGTAGQQQQRQPRMRGWLLQSEEHVAELGAAVRWCQARLTFERLLLELKALQLRVVEPLELVAPALQRQQQSTVGAGPPQQQQQQQQAWQQPRIHLLDVPGVQLFQQLKRKPGCFPGSVGLQEVWFTTGPQYGIWHLHVQGIFYSQSAAAIGARAAAAIAPRNSSSMRVQQVHHGCELVLEYDLRAGHSARDAVLQLLQLLHMQKFLHQLECMARGAQLLEVQVWSGAGAEQQQQDAEGGAAANTSKQEQHATGETPPAKRQRQHQQDGCATATNSNGSVDASAMNGNVQQQAPHGNARGTAEPTSNGNLVKGPPQGEAATAAGAAAAGSGGASGSSRGGSLYGLVFHWAGTGLVRLVQYSCSTAVLECGAPLQPAAAGSAGDTKRQRLQFTVQWQSRYDYTTHSQVSSSSSSGSSSLTTTQVDVRPAAGAVNSWLGRKAGSMSDLLAVSCSMSCSRAHVPAEVLTEFCDMANSGDTDLLLDALAVTAWPLAGITAALAGMHLRNAVSSCMLSEGFRHMRYSIELQQHQRPCGTAGSAGAADASSGAVCTLVLEVLCASQGRVKVLLNEQSANQVVARDAQQQQQQAVAAVACKAAAGTIAGFVLHLKQRHKLVGLLPVLSSGRFQQQLPRQGSAARDMIAGFWVQAHNIELVLCELLQYWQQHANTQHAQQPQQILAAPAADNSADKSADKSATAGTPVQQTQQMQPRTVQPQMQQALQQQVPLQQQVQQHQGQLPGMVPVSRLSQPPQQQQQQEQQLLQNGHVLQQMQAPVASAGL